VEKGKSKTPETLVQDLAGLIDVKGLKANGNRLSQHEVKQVTLVDAEPEIGIALIEPIVVDDVEPIAVEHADDADESEEVAETVAELIVNEVVPEMVEEAELPEIKIEEEAVKETKKKPVFKIEKPESESQEASKSKDEETSNDKSKSEEEPKPAKKIDLEITNPEDIKIDDKGQLGFF
jgi:topoisomerase-4 subunit A